LTGSFAKISGASFSSNSEVSQDPRASATEKQITFFGKAIENILELNNGSWKRFSEKGQAQHRFTTEQEEILKKLVASEGKSVDLSGYTEKDIVIALKRNKAVTALVKDARFGIVELPKDIPAKYAQRIKQCLNEHAIVCHGFHKRSGYQVIEAEKNKVKDTNVPVNEPQDREELIRSTRIGSHYFYRPLKKS